MAPIPMVNCRHMSRATCLAEETNEPTIIYTYDRAEGRAVAVATAAHCDCDEFHAFDGEIVATIWPDGEIEYGPNPLMEDVSC